MNKKQAKTILKNTDQTTVLDDNYWDYLIDSPVLKALLILTGFDTYEQILFYL